VATLEQKLLELAGELRDDAPGREFTAYPRKLLLEWYNDGLCLLGRLRPDVFSRTATVVLKPGAEQEVEGCSVFGSVVAMISIDGTETPVRRSSYITGQQWSKPACPVPPKDYRIKSYRFDATQKRTFYIDPPAPPGREIKAKVVCANIPANLSLTDLDKELDEDCYQFAMVRHYVLSQAYAQDSDQTNLALAGFHLGIWNNFLPATARSDQAFAGGLLGTAPVAASGRGR
jgi:hypothetical protein